MRLLETPRSGNCEQVKVICNKTLIVVYKSAETHKSLGRLPQSKLVRFQHTILAGWCNGQHVKAKNDFRQKIVQQFYKLYSLIMKRRGFDSPTRHKTCSYHTNWFRWLPSHGKDTSSNLVRSTKWPYRIMVLVQDSLKVRIRVRISLGPHFCYGAVFWF